MPEEFTITVDLDDLHEQMLDDIGQETVEQALAAELDGQIETVIYQLYRQE